MENIVIVDGADYWEFLHTRDLGGRSSLRLRASRVGGKVWSMTALAPNTRKLYAVTSDGHKAVWPDEKKNTGEAHVGLSRALLSALAIAGPDARFKEWPRATQTP